MKKTQRIIIIGLLFSLSSFKLNQLVAIGLNSFGESKTFPVNFFKKVDCHSEQLTELILPIGIISIDCHNNKLTELKLTENLKVIDCNSNQLTYLELPDSLIYLNCRNNPIKEITLPKTIKTAILPLNCNVLNMDELKDIDDIKIYFKF